MANSIRFTLDEGMLIKGPHGDAPLQFTEWIKPRPGLFLVPAWIGTDLEVSHDWFGGTAPGLRRLESEAYFTVIIRDPDDVEDPEDGDGGQPPVPVPPDNPPPRIPPEGIPFDPGGFGGDGPGGGITPPGPGGGPGPIGPRPLPPGGPRPRGPGPIFDPRPDIFGPGRPFAGGDLTPGSGPGRPVNPNPGGGFDPRPDVFGPQSDPSDRGGAELVPAGFGQGLPGEPGGPPIGAGAGTRIKRPDAHSDVIGQDGDRDLVATPLGIGMGGILGFPQHYAPGKPNLRDMRPCIKDDMRKEWRDVTRRPTTIGVHAWGHQLGAGWEYTTAPRTQIARHPGGSASGGWLITPPEIGVEDHANPPANLPQSTTAVTLKNVALGFACVDPDQGKQIDGFYVKKNATDLEIGTLDADGVEDSSVEVDQTSGNVTKLKPLSTVGDILYHDGTDLERLPIGTSGQVLAVSGALEPEWIDNTGGGGSTAETELPAIRDSFVSPGEVGSTVGTANTIGELLWKELSSGTISNGEVAAGHPGIVQLVPAQNDYAGFYTGDASDGGQLTISSDGSMSEPIKVEWLIRVRNSVSSTNLNSVQVGIAGGGTGFDANGLPDDHILVTLEPGSASAWRLSVSEGGTRTTQNGTTEPFTDGWATVGFVYTDTGSGYTVQLIVNGSPEGTAITTNAPIGEELYFYAKLDAASSSGAGLPTLDVDTFEFFDGSQVVTVVTAETPAFEIVSSAKTLVLNTVYQVDASGGAFTLTLPAAPSTAVKDLITVMDKENTSFGSFRVTIAAAGGEFIGDGKSSVTLKKGQTLEFRSNGTGWYWQ